MISIGDKVLVTDAGDVNRGTSKEFWVEPTLYGEVGTVIGYTTKWHIPTYEVIFPHRYELSDLRGKLKIANGQYLPLKCVVKVNSPAKVVDKEYEDLLI